MEMSDIFAGLVKMPPMNKAYHSVCFDAKSRNMTEPDMFFLSRPMEEETPNTTLNLLLLCTELIEKVKVQAEQVDYLSREVARLSSIVTRMETDIAIPSISAQPMDMTWLYPSAQPVTIDYSSNTTIPVEEVERAGSPHRSFHYSRNSPRQRTFEEIVRESMSANMHDILGGNNV